MSLSVPVTVSSQRMQPRQSAHTFAQSSGPTNARIPTPSAAVIRNPTMFRACRERSATFVKSPPWVNISRLPACKGHLLRAMLSECFLMTSVLFV